MSNTKPQIEKAHWTPAGLMPEKLHVHILFSNYRKSKIKKKIKEATGKNFLKYLTYRGPKIRIASKFSSGTIHVRRVRWNVSGTERQNTHLEFCTL